MNKTLFFILNILTDINKIIFINMNTSNVGLWFLLLIYLIYKIIVFCL